MARPVMAVRGASSGTRVPGRDPARVAVVGLALLGACAAPEARTLEVDALPASVAYLLVVGLDEAGEVVGGTGLVPVVGGRADAFGELPGAASLEVHGFGVGALAPVAPLPGEAVLRASPVRVALDSEVVLPPPTWTRVFDGDDASPREAPARALTAAWLPACPRRVPEGSVLAMSCATDKCTPRLTQVGCVLQLDAAACGLSDAEGTVGARGEVALESIGRLGTCQERQAPAGVALSLACTTARGEGCDLDVVTDLAPPSFDVATSTPTAVARFSSRDNPRPPVGVVVGLAPLATGVLVVRLDEPRVSWDCRPERRAWVDVYSAADLRRVATSTAPPCTMRGVRDPLGRGMLALVGGAQPGLLVVGPDGRPGPLVPFGAAAPRANEASIALVATRDRVLVALTDYLAPPVGTTLLDVDPVTLVVRAGASLPVHAEVLGSGVDGEPMILTDVVDTLSTLDDGLALRDSTPLRERCNGNLGMKPALIHPFAPARTLLLPSLDDEAQTLFQLDPSSGACSPLAFPGAPRDATALATWPRDPERVLVGLLAERTRGSLALLDVHQRRWVGGELPLDLGPLDLATPDDEGRIWLLAPWTGHLVRVTPRP